jgi:hypothetical protein
MTVASLRVSYRNNRVVWETGRLFLIIAVVHIVDKSEQRNNGHTKT